MQSNLTTLCQEIALEYILSYVSSTALGSPSDPEVKIINCVNGKSYVALDL